MFEIKTGLANNNSVISGLRNKKCVSQGSVRCNVRQVF